MPQQHRLGLAIPLWDMSGLRGDCAQLPVDLPPERADSFLLVRLQFGARTPIAHEHGAACILIDFNPYRQRDAEQGIFRHQKLEPVEPHNLDQHCPADRHLDTCEDLLIVQHRDRRQSVSAEHPFELLHGLVEAAIGSDDSDVGHIRPRGPPAW